MSKNAHLIQLWPHLPYFMALARAQNLQGAGKTLKSDRTTVRRRVDQLEALLEGQLFDRHEGRFQLTPLGQKLLTIAEIVEEDFSKIYSLAPIQGTQQPSGLIRISASSHVLDMFATLLTSFTRQFPQVQLELSESNQLLSLDDHNADIAIRISKDNPSLPLTGSSLGSIKAALYCKKGRPLEHMPYIGVIGEREVPEHVRAYLPEARMHICVDGVIAHRELIASGAGAGVLPCFSGDRDGRIERVSREYSGLGRRIWLVTHAHSRTSPRIRAFFEFAEQNRNLV